MFSRLASYLMGGAAEAEVEGETVPAPLTPHLGDELLAKAPVEQAAATASPTAASEPAQENPRLRQTEVEGDDWILIDRYVEGSAGMEESWYVTPPACFTRQGPVHVETSPLENLLIEHPSMSVYAGALTSSGSASATANTSINSDTTLVDVDEYVSDAREKLDRKELEMVLNSFPADLRNFDKREFSVRFYEEMEATAAYLFKDILNEDLRGNEKLESQKLQSKEEASSQRRFTDNWLDLRPQNHCKAPASLAPRQWNSPRMPKHQLAKSSQQQQQQEQQRRQGMDNQENRQPRHQRQQRPQTNANVSERQRRTTNVRDNRNSSADDNVPVAQIRSAQQVLQKRSTQSAKRNRLDRANKVREVASGKSHRPRRQDRLRLNNSFANNNRKC